MALPDFSYLPEELRLEVLKQSQQVQENFAGMTAEQIEKRLMVSAEAVALAGTVKLTAEEKAMGSEAFIDLCIERSQAMKRERIAARAAEKAAQGEEG